MFNNDLFLNFVIDCFVLSILVTQYQFLFCDPTVVDTADTGQYEIYITANLVKIIHSTTIYFFPRHFTSLRLIGSIFPINALTQFRQSFYIFKFRPSLIECRKLHCGNSSKMMLEVCVLQIQKF